MSNVRFRLRTLLIGVAIIALTLPISLHWTGRARAMKSYMQMEAAWRADRELCDGVIDASRHLMQVEAKWAWLDRSGPRDRHLERLDQMLKRAIAAQKTTTYASFEGMNREVKVISAEIAAVGGTAP